MILNTKVRDSGAKLIFSDNDLCAQFLKNYVDIPCLKEVQSKDIEDVSEQFVPLFGEERDGDRIKRVNIKSKIPFFLVSLVEHKTKVEYTVNIQIFRYMVYIWDSYIKEMEAKQSGISKRKDFKYPPILPIVYYEGKRKWTAPLDFKSKILGGEMFQKFIPDFSYYLVPLRDYSNEELLERGDEISLVMLLNKIQEADDIEAFRRLPADRFSEILKDTPDDQAKIIADVFLTFLLKLNVPAAEAQELAGKVREKKMPQLFENMEKMDIQEERRKTREATEALQQAKREAKTTIKSMVELCQSLGGTKEALVTKMTEDLGLSPEEAWKKTDEYWTE